jgi:putative zinc finger protein
MSAGRAERACPAPLPLSTLVDHWAGELAPADEAVVEEHLMACGACAERAASLGRLAAATRQLIARGRVPLVLTPALLARLERDGVRIRRHVVEAGGQTRCTAGPDDDLIAVTLRAPLRAGERVDLVYLEAPAGLDLGARWTDVPVDVARGEVVFVEPGDAIRPLPAGRARLSLLGVGPAGERTIGEFTLLHTPWAGAAP